MASFAALSDPDFEAVARACRPGREGADLVAVRAALEPYRVRYMGSRKNATSEEIYEDFAERLQRDGRIAFPPAFSLWPTGTRRSCRDTATYRVYKHDFDESAFAGRETTLLFHGTKAPLGLLVANMQTTANNVGYYGPGAYFTPSLRTAQGYTGFSGSVLVFECLVDRLVRTTADREYLVEEPVQGAVVPRFLISNCRYDDDGCTLSSFCNALAGVGESAPRPIGEYDPAVSFARAAPNEQIWSVDHGFWRDTVRERHARHHMGLEDRLLNWEGEEEERRRREALKRPRVIVLDSAKRRRVEERQWRAYEEASRTLRHVYEGLPLDVDRCLNKFASAFRAARNDPNTVFERVFEGAPALRNKYIQRTIDEDEELMDDIRRVMRERRYEEEPDEEEPDEEDSDEEDSDEEDSDEEESDEEESDEEFTRAALSHAFIFSRMSGLNIDGEEGLKDFYTKLWDMCGLR